MLCGARLGISNKARRLTEAQLDGYLYRLSQPGGLTPPLNYFRAFLRLETCSAKINILPLIL